jgi:hypothetical protein
VNARWNRADCWLAPEIATNEVISEYGCLDSKPDGIAWVIFVARLCFVAFELPREPVHFDP